MTASLPLLNEQLSAAIHNPRLMRAGAALAANDLPIAERLLKAHLTDHPWEVTAMRMLAEVAARLRRYSDAEILLERALELQPGFRAARLNYCSVLQRTEKIEAASREIAVLLADAPDDPAALVMAAAIHVRRGEFEQAVAKYEAILALGTPQPQIRLSLGHVLKTLGKQAGAVSAYRAAIAEAPQFGEAWWSLANLKTVRFSDGDIGQMRQALRDAMRIEDRIHLNFALGKALEDAARYEESFSFYNEGNHLRGSTVHFDGSQLTALVDRTLARLSKSDYLERADQGHQTNDPIFIVGLPRSGSTLVEQILASHSNVEGTAELPHIPAIVRQLVKGRTDEDARYIDVLLRLSPEERRALGQQYLSLSRVQRKTDKARFIDKLPNNFAHVGLIKLILPNATIIDARRHPIATCFSCYKQHFARGQDFTYNLDDLARYYIDYVRLMTYFDRIAPGAVHRVVHENLVKYPEREIRRLLDACDLEFEPNCLDFHRTERPIRTASSEQVRQPLRSDGIDQWRNYAPWLGTIIGQLNAAGLATGHP